MWPFIILSITVIAADRALKLIVFKSFSPGSSYPLLNNILHITPVCNKGIAFGLFAGLSRYITITTALLTSIFILYILVKRRPRSRLLIFGLIFVFSGAVGNLIDRAMFGYVMDFIDIRIWPVFNIADSSITIGASLILIYLIIVKRKT